MCRASRRRSNEHKILQNGIECFNWGKEDAVLANPASQRPCIGWIHSSLRVVPTLLPPLPIVPPRKHIVSFFVNTELLIISYSASTSRSLALLASAFQDQQRQNLARKISRGFEVGWLESTQYERCLSLASNIHIYTEHPQSLTKLYGLSNCWTANRLRTSTCVVRIQSRQQYQNAFFRQPRITFHQSLQMTSDQRPGIIGRGLRSSTLQQLFPMLKMEARRRR
jgi:hypothetical protein